MNWAVKLHYFIGMLTKFYVLLQTNTFIIKNEIFTKVLHISSIYHY
jgi:hypothetical protein